MASQFPQFYAGQQITSELLASMLPQFAVATTTTSRASNTTVSADPYLTFPVNSGSLYIVEFWVLFTGLPAAGIQTQWLVPTGTGGSRTCIGPASNASNSDGDQELVRIGGYLFSSAKVYSAARGSTTSPNTLTETAYVAPASNGNVAFGWAQAVSNATAIDVYAGSWGRCTQIG